MRMFKRSAILQSLTLGLSHTANNAQPPASVDPYASNVVLLLHMDDVAGSKVFTDVMGHTVQALGDAVQSTAKTIAGTAVGYFDGVGDQLAILPKAASPDDFLFPGDFTIEGKTIFNVTTGGAQSLFGSKSGSLYFNVRWYGTSDVWQVSLNSAGGTAISNSGPTFRPVVNQLIDYALVRIAGVIKLYINGVWTGVSLNNSSALGFSNLNAYVSSTNSANYANVYADEVRVTKGVGRYAANYTPQVGKFPDPVVAVLGKGYAVGGWTSTPSSTLTSIESLNFANAALATSSAVLDTGIQGAAGISTPLIGYVAGGSTDADATITKFRKLTFSTEAVTNVVATFNGKKDTPSGFASSTLGYLAAGLNGSSGARASTIDSISLATEAIDQAMASLNAVRNRAATLNSTVCGYLAGGVVSSQVSSIDSFVYSTNTATMLSSSLPTTNTGGCGASSALAGYTLGGNYGGSYQSTTSKLIFATNVCSALSAVLSLARGENPSSMASTVDGFVTGGYNSGSAATLTDIDKINFATDTTTRPAITLASSRCYAAGLSSNA